MILVRLLAAAASAGSSGLGPAEHKRDAEMISAEMPLSSTRQTALEQSSRSGALLFGPETDECHARGGSGGRAVRSGSRVSSCRAYSGPEWLSVGLCVRLGQGGIVCAASRAGGGLLVALTSPSQRDHSNQHNLEHTHTHKTRARREKAPSRVKAVKWPVVSGRRARHDGWTGGRPAARRLDANPARPGPSRPTGDLQRTCWTFNRSKIGE
jgi:hypothetical protein